MGGRLLLYFCVTVAKISAEIKPGIPLAKPRFLDFDNTHTVLCGTGQSRDSVAKNTAQSDGA